MSSPGAKRQRDAGNLAWKLDAVLRGAPGRLMDSYQVERCRHVTKMQNFAIRWGAAVQTRRPWLARLRDSAIGGLESSGALDWLQSRAKPLPTAAAGAFANRPHPFPPNRTVGALFPQPVIDGVRLDDRLGTGWGAVSASPEASARLRAAGLTVVDVADDAWLRRHSLDFALLRPDRYVFACGAAAEAGAAAAAARGLVGDGLRSAAVASRGAVAAWIALLGATGTIGRHVAADLADRGVDARAVVRDRSRSDVPLPLVHGDLTRPQTLPAAFDGAERLLLLTPHGPDQDLREAAAVEAAVAAGVQRIVKISGGAPSLGPNGPSPTAIGHWRTERLIEATGLRWTFLRPSFLVQNVLSLPLTGGFLLAPMGHAPVAMIDARDVAACAVAALTGSDGDGAWHLTGPRGVTLADVAPHLGARRYLNLPRKVAATAMRRRGAPPFEVEHAIGMAAYLASGADSTPTNDVRRLTGRPPRSLEQFFNDEKGT